jgi:hypothetical protein
MYVGFGTSGKPFKVSASRDRWRNAIKYLEEGQLKFEGVNAVIWFDIPLHDY